MYVVNAGDLQAVTPGNSLMKYADDTYLVIPACVTKKFPTSTSGRGPTTSPVEIIFRDNRKRCCIHSPSPLQGIARVTSLKVLGVTLTVRLSVSAHVDGVVGSSAQSMYAISVLRSHGVSSPAGVPRGRRL